MKNDLPIQHHHEAFTFSTLFAGENSEPGASGNAGILKMPLPGSYSEKLAAAATSDRKTQPEAPADSVIESRIESRYNVDDFGNPRILTRWEATLYAVAWPVVLGVALGYGLIIFAFAYHYNFPNLKLQGKAIQAQVVWQDEAN